MRSLLSCINLSDPVLNIEEKIDGRGEDQEK
jgi:hypothetical protein